MIMEEPTQIASLSNKRKQIDVNKLLPISLSKECAVRGISEERRVTDEFVSQLLACVNLARVDPVFFANNVLECVQMRYQNGTYRSFFGNKFATWDGVAKCNEAIDVMVGKASVPSLEWSPHLAKIAQEFAKVVDYTTVDKKEERKSKPWTPYHTGQIHTFLAKFGPNAEDVVSGHLNC